MAQPNTTNDSPTDGGENNETQPFDAATFADTIADKVDEITERDGKWATDQHTELMMTIITEWLDMDTTRNPANVQPAIRAFANMNATYNALRAAKKITANEAAPKVGSAFIRKPKAE